MQENTPWYGEKKEFTDDIKKFLKENYPTVDIYNLSLDDLRKFRDTIEQKREEYFLLEIANKQLGNAAYGACANQFFYFYNVRLAADITGESRALTKFMWNRLEKFFHEDIWERKDLWKRFNFALDPSKKEWYKDKIVSTYSDTDSNFSKSLLLIDKKNKMTIESAFDMCNKESGIFHTTRWSQEMVRGNGHTVKNYKDGKIVDVPIRFIMRHHTPKKMYKIKTKSGKETIVTEDHSCIVFRNGKQMSIKAKDINIKTDKILSLVNDKH